MITYIVITDHIGSEPYGGFLWIGHLRCPCHQLSKKLKWHLNFNTDYREWRDELFAPSEANTGKYLLLLFANRKD